MKPLYMVFGLWVLVGCFLSGECHRAPRRHPDRRRTQASSTHQPNSYSPASTPQPNPNHVQSGVPPCLATSSGTLEPSSYTLDIPGIQIILQPPPIFIEIPGSISNVVSDPSPQRNPPNQTPPTVKANTNEDQ
ncbi:submaxillary gland androgen-regulated protein 2-like [Mus caroli]|uniref:Submaxillary gland androgen-regulated protein 2-like n=1 Tax=Mus caroli TaxID=10089 RepID=A0A6P5PMK6_MUSCR|nr:submaxillary gland androgen-regulated protein 2-like [Mus caroli]